MPSPSTALVYPGACLVEGTSVSEGRGTCKPFEWIGAPWLDGRRLADELNALDLPGCFFRPISFTPVAFKHANVPCQGVQIHVTHPEVFSSVRMGVGLIEVLRRQSGSHFTYRFLPEYGHYMLDLLHGDDGLRRGEPAEEVYARMREDEERFLQSSRPYYLY